jgi:hypothetical protein
MPAEMIDKEMLKEILAANKELLLEAVREMKKPTETEQQALDAKKAELLAKNEKRRRGATLQKRKAENRKRFQQLHSHEHPKSGKSYCVLVNQEVRDEDNKVFTDSYLICQYVDCQAIIRPGSAPAGATDGHIYDSTLFNKLVQKVDTGSEMTLG